MQNKPYILPLIFSILLLTHSNILSAQQSKVDSVIYLLKKTC